MHLEGDILHHQKTPLLSLALPTLLNAGTIVIQFEGANPSGCGHEQVPSEKQI